MSEHVWSFSFRNFVGKHRISFSCQFVVAIIMDLLFFFSQHMLMRPLRWALWSVLVNLLKRRKVVEKMSFIEDMEHFNSLQCDRECTKYSRAYVLGQSN